LRFETKYFLSRNDYLTSILEMVMMNKTLVITTIALVVVVMGMSAVAPMIPEAFAHGPSDKDNAASHKMCTNIKFLERASDELIDRLCLHVR